LCVNRERWRKVSAASLFKRWPNNWAWTDHAHEETLFLGRLVSSPFCRRGPCWRASVDELLPSASSICLDSSRVGPFVSCAFHRDHGPGVRQGLSPPDTSLSRAGRLGVTAGAAAGQSAAGGDTLVPTGKDAPAGFAAMERTGRPETHTCHSLAALADTFGDVLESHDLWGTQRSRDCRWRGHGSRAASHGNRQALRENRRCGLSLFPVLGTTRHAVAPSRALRRAGRGMGR
jgi:hypothetical protein